MNARTAAEKQTILRQRSFDECIEGSETKADINQVAEGPARVEDFSNI